MSPSIEEFNRWIESLSELDRMNFYALVNLPSGPSVIANMPVGQYKQMATFALASKTLLEKLEGEAE